MYMEKSTQNTSTLFDYLQYTVIFKIVLTMQASASWLSLALGLKTGGNSLLLTEGKIICIPSALNLTNKDVISLICVFF